MTPSRLIDQSVLPVAELTAAVLDGELFELDGCYHSIAEINDCALRAESLKLLPRVIAERMTAAWIYGARLSLPNPIEVCMDTYSRTRPPAGAGFHTREVVIDQSELLTIGSTRVTTPIRTILDLVCLEPTTASEDHADLAPTIARLAAIGRYSLQFCIDALERRFRVSNRSGRAQFLEFALSRIDSDALYPALTR